MNASSRCSGLVLLALATGLLVTGCNSSDVENVRNAAAYDRRANENFQDEDVAMALVQRLAARFPDVLPAEHQGMLAQKRITRPRLLTPTSFGIPPTAIGPAERFFAGIVIDREGRVAALDFAPARSTPINPENQQRATEVLSAWRFTPMMVDDEGTASIHAFELIAVGGTIYVPRPNPWR